MHHQIHTLDRLSGTERGTSLTRTSSVRKSKCQTPCKSTAGKYHWSNEDKQFGDHLVPSTNTDSWSLHIVTAWFELSRLGLFSKKRKQLQESCHYCELLCHFSGLWNSLRVWGFHRAWPWNCSPAWRCCKTSALELFPGSDRPVKPYRTMTIHTRIIILVRSCKLGHWYATAEWRVGLAVQVAGCTSWRQTAVQSRYRTEWRCEEEVQTLCSWPLFCTSVSFIYFI